MPGGVLKTAYKKANEGKTSGGGGGVPSSDSTMAAVAAALLADSASHGVENTAARLAELAAMDRGAFDYAMECIRWNFGDAAADTFIKDIEERMGQLGMLSSEEQQNFMSDPPKSTPQELIDHVVVKMAEGLSVSKEDALADFAEPGSEPDPNEVVAGQKSAAEAVAAQFAAEHGPPMDPSNPPMAVDSGAAAEAAKYSASGIVKGGTAMIDPAAADPATVAHEMAHVAQQIAGEAGGGNASGTPAIEADADRIAKTFLEGGGVPTPTAVMGPADVAADSGGGAAAPTDFTFSFGGASVTVPMPANANKTVTLNIDAPGALAGVLTLGPATINFDDSWNCQGGSITAGIQVGSYVSMPSVSLEIDPTGAVQATIEGAQLNVGSLINATITLQIGADGITGTATATHGQMTLPLGISLKSGSVTVGMDTSGSISGGGTLEFDVPGVGIAILTASVNDEEIVGKVGVTPTGQINLTDGVDLLEFNLEGDFSSSGFGVMGGARINVKGLFEASIAGGYKYPDNLWSANGTLTQIAPLTAGPLTVTDGAIDVVIQDNALVSVGGGGTYALPHFTGRLGGTYDVGANEFSGECTAELTDELALGGSGAKLTAANGSATIEKNELVQITSNVTAEMPFRGEPTFQAVATECVYDVKANNLSGTGTVTTLRDLEFSAGSFKVTVATGASAGVTVTDNEVAEVTGSLNFTVTDETGELGGGSASLTFSGGSVSGDATFTLASDLGFPSRAEGPAFITSGSSLTVAIADNAPTSITANGVGFEVRELGSDQSGVVTGSVNGTVSLPDFGLDGTGTASVSSAWTQSIGVGSITLKEGGTITVTAAGGSVSEVTLAQVGFGVEITSGPVPVSFDGNIDGSYDVDANEATGTIDVSLVGEARIPVGSDEVVIKQPTKASATVAANDLQSMTFQLSVDYIRAGEPFVSGSIPDGNYDATSGEVSFTGNLSLVKAIEVQNANGTWTFKVNEGASLTATVEANNLVKVECPSIGFEVHDSEGLLLNGSLTGGILIVEGMKFSGELGVTVARNYSFPRDGGEPGEGISLTVKTGSTVNGSLSENELTSASVALQFDVGGVVTGTGHVNGEWNVSDDKVSGDGAFQLTQDYVLAGASSPGEDLTTWQLCIAANSSVAILIADNELQEATIDVEIKLNGAQGCMAGGRINGTYKFGDSGGFTGGATVDIEQEVELVAGDRFSVYLSPDTNVTGQVASSELVSASGDFIIVAKEGGEPAVQLSVNCTYTADTGVNGTADLAVLKEILLGGAGGYEVFMGTDTGGSVSVADSELGAVSGDLSIEVAKDGTRFAKGTFSVDYDFSQGANASIDAEGGVEIIGSLELGEAAGYKFTLLGGSGVSFKVSASELDWAEGSLKLSVGDPEEFFTIDIGGKYTAGDNPEFTGGGTATVTREKDLGAELLGWSFILCPTDGPTVEFQLAASELVSISGNIKIQARKEGGTIDITMGGDYDHGSTSFTGSGTCTVNQDLPVGQVGEWILTVSGGSGLSISINQNEVEEISGNLSGKVDWDGDFLSFNCEVTYRSANDGEVDIDGSCELTGEKQIFTLTPYEFWLTPGTGAEVKVEANELIEVGGQVSFKIMDGESEPLLEGKAEGKYTAADGKFNGSGAVYLGRDVEFGNDTLTIYFLKGSGGDATVEDSELRRLGGTLKADIAHDGEKVVHVEAAGEYDAVEKNIVQCSGSATLLKPLELLGGRVKLLGASGHATIENNELVEAGGQASVWVDGFDQINGQIEFEWSNRSGTDEYSGSATLDIVFNDKISGSAKVELLPGGEFKMEGSVTYTMNEMIEGTLKIRVDSDLNPELDGEIVLNEKEIVPGRDLFGLDMDVLPSTNVPLGYGFNLVFGCKAGMKASMQPVTFSARIAVLGFRPLDMNMPTFEVGATVSAGLDFSAAVAPWIALSWGVTGFQVGGGLQGKLELLVPITASAGVTLRGGPAGYSGDFKLGLKINPSVNLEALAFLFVELGAQARYEFDPWSFPLGEIFSYEWDKTYTFGDAGTGASDGGATVAEAAPTEGTQSMEETSESSVPSMAGGGGGGGAVAGGPDLNAGGDPAGGAGGGEGGGSEMMDKIAEVEEYAKKVASVADLFGTVMTIISLNAIPPPFGQAAVVLYLCYRIFWEQDLTLSSIVDSVTNLFSLLAEGLDWIMEALRAEYPTLFDIWDWIQEGAKNILDGAIEWIGDNLKALADLGGKALDYLNDVGEWGRELISNAGEWAMEAAGWAMDALSDAGEAVADFASDAWDTVSSWW